MKEYHAHLFAASQCELGECPVYDEREDRLYWLDITKDRIHFQKLEEAQFSVLQLDRPIGSIVLTRDGQLLAGMDDGVYRVDGTVCTPYCLVAESIVPENRFNDGKCDPGGHFYVGTKMETPAAPPGVLCRIHGEHTYEVVADGLSCSNGLAWDRARGRMYHIDTRGGSESRMYVYACDGETGDLSLLDEGAGFAKRLLPGVLPDGMTIDREGNLWIALWGGFGIGCWDPRTWEQLAFVHVPAARVSSCAFGGRDFRDLYITTAKLDGIGGNVYRARVDAEGLPCDRFGPEREEGLA